jgi:hypothetical protein
MDRRAPVGIELLRQLRSGHRDIRSEASVDLDERFTLLAFHRLMCTPQRTYEAE